MDRRWGAVLLVLVAGAAVAGASPTPSPVCELCGGSFERAAADRGVPATATEVRGSQLDVYLRADGDARRVVRNRVNESTARYFDEHPRKLRGVARAAVGRRGPADPGSIDARVDVDDRTIVVAYRAEDVASRSVGVLVYDRYLTDDRALWAVNADRFTVHAPEDHRLASDPRAERRGPSAVAWRGQTTDRAGLVDDRFDHRTYVAFAPDGSVAPEARATLALAIRVLPTALGQFAVVLAPAVVLFGAGLSAATLARRRVRSWRPESVGVAVVALVAGLFALASVASIDLGPELLAGPLAALGLAAVAHPRLRPETTQEAVVAAAVPVAVAAGVVLALSPPGERAVAAGVGVQFGACLLLGFLQARRASPTRRAAVVGLIGAPHVLWAVRELPVYGGFGVLPVAVFGAVLTVAAAAVGTALYCLGIAVGARSDDADAVGDR